MPSDPQSLRISVDETIGEVSALLDRPAEPRALLVLAHGAGAGMQHRFMQAITEALVEREVAVLRYQFPYTEAGRKRPDRPPRLLATVQAAVDHARDLAPDLPLFAGGKSMGGRMTTTAASAGRLPDVRGVVLLGFPLHAAGKPSITRGEHLAQVPVPMLFVQGTRDTLADRTLLDPIVAELGERARVHSVEDGDHSFAVRKTRGHDPAAVIPGIADAVAGWVSEVAPG